MIRDHTGTGKADSEAEPTERTSSKHTNDNVTHEQLMHHEQNSGVHFRESFGVSLMRHANQTREKHEDATGVSLTVYFQKCSMNRQELTTVV